MTEVLIKIKEGSVVKVGNLFPLNTSRNEEKEKEKREKKRIPVCHES